ncbi:MAG TPA: hypothetical protein VIO61_07620 [Anaerolineaceae bacterium]
MKFQRSRFLKPGNLLLIGSGLLLAGVALLSLKWRMVHDAPIMMYLAYIIDRFGMLPYRDFIDSNLPGTYLFFLIIGKLFGYSDLGFRLVDLLVLVLVLYGVYLWLRPFGERTGITAALIYGFFYLGDGQILSLQREQLVAFLIILALNVSTFSFNKRVRLAAMGFVFGLAAMIKPQSVIGLPLLLAYEYWQGFPTSVPVGNFSRIKEWFRLILWCGVGFAIPIALFCGYLVLSGTAGDFIDLVKNYWGLYYLVTGDFQTVTPAERTSYLLERYLTFGGQIIWLAPAIYGVFLVWFKSDLAVSLKRRSLLILSLALVYSLYPVSTGMFWRYHWLPFAFCIIQAGCLVLIEQSRVRFRWERLLPVGLLIFAVIFRIRLPGEFLQQVKGESIPPPKAGRVDAIAAFLTNHLEPGDLVQPLDGTGGAVHAMLISKARLATPTVYDFHFYHHLENPYIQRLKREFLTALRKTPPRFIVEIDPDKPYPIGSAATREFPELRQYLSSFYSIAEVGEGYFIYERLAGQ